MPETVPPLAQALLKQSLAAAKNRIRAQKAAQEGRTDAAAVLLALAWAQEVHAKKALLMLRGRIEATDRNLTLALQETREIAADTVDWTHEALLSGDATATALLTQMAKTLASHLALRPQDGQALFVCAICGLIHAGPAGQPPGRCPVCQALPEKFHAVGGVAPS